MKKRRLFTLGLALATAVTFTSCEDDDDDEPVGPNLNITELNSGEMGGDLTITQGTDLEFRIDARRGETDLETFSVSTSGVNATSPIPTSAGGNTFPYTIDNADDELYIDTVSFNNATANIGVTTYTFTVEDGVGQSESVTYTVEVVASLNPLSAPMDFTWQRIGSDPGTGLDQFGLQWTNNSATNAIVAIDDATTMVELDASAWDNITTQEGLADAIEAADPINQYVGVSSVQSNSYDDVLGVNYDGNYYILNIQEGSVTSTSTGTTITIDGQYKN